MPSESKLGTSPIKLPEAKQLKEDSISDAGQEAINKKIEELEQSIEKTLKILAPLEEDEEEYVDSQYDSLIEDAEEFLRLGKASVISELEILEKAKKILTERLHAVIDDVYEFSRPNRPPVDSGLLRRTKLALLREHDLHNGGGQSLKELNIRKLSSWFNSDPYGPNRSHRDSHLLSTKEVDSLIEAGYGDNLLDGFDLYTFRDYFEDLCMPESLFKLYLAKEFDNNSWHVVVPTLQGKIKRGEKFSKEIFNKLLHSGLSHECLEHFNAFEGGDIFEVIRKYNIGYPYNASRQIGIIKKLGLDTPELIDYVVKNNWITNNDQKILEEYGDYNKFFGKINSGPVFASSAPPNSEDMSFAKGLISSGKLGLFYREKGFVEYLLQNEREWFMNEVIRQDQEFLILRNMNSEEVSTYLNKLLDNKEYEMVKDVLSYEGRNFQAHVLESSLYERIAVTLPEEVMLSLVQIFKDLPSKIYTELLETLPDNQRTNDTILKVIESFDFGDNPAFKTQKEYQSFVAQFQETGIPLPFSGSGWENTPISFSTFTLVPETERMHWINTLKDLKNSVNNPIPISDIIKTLSLNQPLFSLPAPERQALFADLDTIRNLIKRDTFSQKALQEDFSPSQISETKNVLLSIQGFLSKSDFSEKNIDSYLQEAAESKSVQELKVLSDRTQLLLGETFSYSESTHLIYLSEFARKDSTLEERRAFLKRVEGGVNAASRNQPVLEDNQDVYRVICEEVYPKRNYNSYSHIEQYKDRSKDLDGFKFNKEGYRIKLDGVQEYRVKEGEEIDPSILEKYSGRVQKLVSLANPEALERFMTNNISASGAEDISIPETLEGKILKYIQGKTDDEISDVMFAYQLRDEYQAFLQGTRDQAGEESTQVEKEYIMLTELAERYGDRLKETIKEIFGKVMSGPDKDVFTESGEKLVSEDDVRELADKISLDLAKLPQEKITDKVVQKKIIATLKARFQKIYQLKDQVESLAMKFGADSVSNLPEQLPIEIAEVLRNIAVIGNLDGKHIEAIQDKCYREIQIELEKYEEVMEVDTLKEKFGAQEKTIKKRSIHGYFSKNRENAHARMVADVCIAADPKMLENPNYFEFVLFDEDREKNIGTVMLLVMEEPKSKKKYLLYCPNPSTDIVSKVSSGKLYQWLTKQVTDFAEANGFEGVLTDTRHGHATNRPGKFYESLTSSVVREKDGSSKKMNLKQSHSLGGSYAYQNDLSVIWEKP